MLHTRNSMFKKEIKIKSSLEEIVKSRKYSLSLTPPLPLYVFVRFWETPSPHTCVRNLWMTPKEKYRLTSFLYTR
jgi:hypothetical protein